MYIKAEYLEDIAKYIGYGCEYTVEEFDNYLFIAFNVTLDGQGYQLGKSYSLNGQWYQLGKNYPLFGRSEREIPILHDISRSAQEFKRYLRQKEII